MRIGVLGTGRVGQALAGGLAGTGHEVMIGSRNPEAFAPEEKLPDGVEVGDLPTTSGWAEVVINATPGSASLEALTAAGAANLDGKVLIDVANPLEFADGAMSLFVCNTDSLAEQIQRAFPKARAVKTLNTVNSEIMIDPGQLAGEHAMFVSGNDAAAKATVGGMLKDLGWLKIVDLGDLTAARAQEMYLPLWLKLMGVLGDTRFNIAIAR